jgi:pantothenate kinase
MGGTAFDVALAAFLTRLGEGGGEGSAARLVRTDPVTAAFGCVGVDLVGMAGERVEWFRQSAALCPAVSLEVAGHAVQAGLSPGELWRFYLPICQTVAALRRNGRVRTLVGVAGPGASGKSVFAGLLRAVMRAGGAEAGAGAALCAMDGFHYPNAYLDAHFGEDCPGARVPLRVLKGAPDTFDAEAFVRCLRDLKAGADMIVPRYDRRLHDPVPDGSRVGPEDRVVLVEGNYLLLDRGVWAAVSGLLDLRLFLTAPPKALRAAMIERHVRGRPRGPARRGPAYRGHRTAPRRRRARPD